MPKKPQKRELTKRERQARKLAKAEEKKSSVVEIPEDILQPVRAALLSNDRFGAEAALRSLMMSKTGIAQWENAFTVDGLRQRVMLFVGMFREVTFTNAIGTAKVHLGGYHLWISPVFFLRHIKSWGDMLFLLLHEKEHLQAHMLYSQVVSFFEYLDRTSDNFVANAKREHLKRNYIEDVWANAKARRNIKPQFDLSQRFYANPPKGDKVREAQWEKSLRSSRGALLGVRGDIEQWIAYVKKNGLEPSLEKGLRIERLKGNVALSGITSVADWWKQVIRYLLSTPNYERYMQTMALWRHIDFPEEQPSLLGEETPEKEIPLGNEPPPTEEEEEAKENSPQKESGEGEEKGGEDEEGEDGSGEGEGEGEESDEDGEGEGKGEEAEEGEKGKSAGEGGGEDSEDSEDSEEDVDASSSEDDKSGGKEDEEDGEEGEDTSEEEGESYSSGEGTEKGEGEETGKPSKGEKDDGEEGDDNEGEQSSSEGDEGSKESEGDGDSSEDNDETETSEKSGKSEGEELTNGPEQTYDQWNVPIEGISESDPENESLDKHDSPFKPTRRESLQEPSAGKNGTVIRSVLVPSCDPDALTPQMQLLLDLASATGDASTDAFTFARNIIRQVSDTVVGNILAARARTEHTRKTMFPHITKRTAVQLGMGHIPTLYEYHTDEPQPPVDLYVDVSGSMERFYVLIPQLTKMLSGHVGKVWQFSDDLWQVDEQDTRLYTTGGTSYVPVAQEILDSGATEVIILTDNTCRLDRTTLDALGYQLTRIVLISTALARGGHKMGFDWLVEHAHEFPALTAEEVILQGAVENDW